MRAGQTVSKSEQYRSDREGSIFIVSFETAEEPSPAPSHMGLRTERSDLKWRSWEIRRFRMGSGHDQPCIKAKVAAVTPGVAAFGSAIFDLMNQLRHLGDSLHRALMPSRSQSDDNSNYCDH
jgi:hypothetical protein